MTGLLPAQDNAQDKAQEIEPAAAQAVQQPTPNPVDPLLEEARKLASEGKLRDAAEAYTRWLAENPGHSDFGIILIEAAESQLSIERSLELLRIYTPRVQNVRQKEVCRASQIDLLEMLGRSEQALGLLHSFPPTSRWLYRQAQLLYQQGLNDAAEKSLELALKALLSDVNAEIDREGGVSEEAAHMMARTELEARIRLLQARIFVLEGEHKQADNLFKLLVQKYQATELAPGILFAYYEYLLSRGHTKAAEQQLERLSTEFPNSPELALARRHGEQKKIDYASTPARLLPRVFPEPTGESRQAGEPEAAEATHPEAEPSRPAVPLQPQPEPEPQTVFVQTGSFRDRENAQYMVRDLKTDGFAAEIVEKQIGTTLYYRVVIGPLKSIEAAQSVLMKLKDAGFEGVLLFPE
jgi:cell division septation protein DedD